MDEITFKKMVNGITPDIKKAKLEAIVAVLPGSVRVVKHVYRGDQMIKKGIKVDDKGRPIKKGGVYYQDQYDDIDARKEVFEAWNKGRDVAVKKWFKEWLKNHLEMMPQRHLFDNRYKRPSLKKV